MIKPTKRYIVWLRTGPGEAYSPYEYDTVEEALIADKNMTEWYLTEAINHLNAYARYQRPEEEITK